jgi:hypothetical protein
MEISPGWFSKIYFKTKNALQNISSCVFCAGGGLLAALFSQKQ